MQPEFRVPPSRVHIAKSKYAGLGATTGWSTVVTNSGKASAARGVSGGAWKKLGQTKAINLAPKAADSFLRKSFTVLATDEDTATTELGTNSTGTTTRELSAKERLALKHHREMEELERLEKEALKPGVRKPPTGGMSYARDE
jgi:hypothetical protein